MCGQGKDSLLLLSVTLGLGIEPVGTLPLSCIPSLFGCLCYFIFSTWSQAQDLAFVTLVLVPLSYIHSPAFLILK